MIVLLLLTLLIAKTRQLFAHLRSSGCTAAAVADGMKAAP